MTDLALEYFMQDLCYDICNTWITLNIQYTFLRIFQFEWAMRCRRLCCHSPYLFPLHLIWIRCHQIDLYQWIEVWQHVRFAFYFRNSWHILRLPQKHDAYSIAVATKKFISHRFVDLSYLLGKFGWVNIEWPKFHWHFGSDQPYESINLFWSIKFTLYHWHNHALIVRVGATVQFWHRVD